MNLTKTLTAEDLLNSFSNEVLACVVVRRRLSSAAVTDDG